MANFSLIRVLCEHSKMIFWCTKLSRANKQDAKEIEAQMRGNSELAQILKQLNEADSEGPGRKRRKKEQQSAFSINPDPDEMVESDLKPSEALDLGEIMFDGGSHFMTNKKCHLPDGSTRQTKKGYEEVYVPPPKKPEMVNEKLVKVADFWVSVDNAYEYFRYFN